MASTADYRPARREAIVALLIWVAAIATTVGVSYILGYTEATPETIFGIPRWVVLGIFMPWIIFFGVHTWFTLYFGREKR